MPDQERPRHRTHGARCPHCGARAIVRTSRELSRLYSEKTMQCTNAYCSYSYVVGVEVLRTLSPSATPSPDVRIPQSTHPCAGKPRADAQA